MITAEFERYYTSYTEYMAKPRVIRESVESTNVGFFLGSFKPPHIGHFNAVKEGMTMTNAMHVIISPGFRGMTKEDHKLYMRIKRRRYTLRKQGKPIRGVEEQIEEMESKMISPMQSKLIWDEYAKALKLGGDITIHSVEGSKFPDPVKYTEQLMMEYGAGPGGENIHVSIFIGEDDLEKGDPRNAPLKAVPGLGSISEVPALRSHSATDARMALVDGDREKFVESQPEHPAINKDYIWDILYDNFTY